MPQITVGTSPVSILKMDSRRQSLILKNGSAAGKLIYLMNTTPDGLTTGNADQYLDPGEVVYFNLPTDGPDIQQPWSAVCSGVGEY